MGKFVVKQVKTGVIFNLKAGNGEVIATSEIYATEAACMNGTESIRRNAIEAKLEDQTVEGYEAVTNPKFEVYTDKAGEFRFRLKAKNGEIIATGLGILDRDYIGIYAIHVREDYRRRGYARQICTGLLNEGKKRGASHAYLQVVKNNTSAEKLYSSLGFQYSYTYWFRVQPVGTRFQ